MLSVNYTLLLFCILAIGLVGVPKEPSIKQLVAFFTMLLGVLGALLTFFLTLPPSETILAVIGTLTIIIAVLAAFIKMLKEIDKVVEKEVTVRVNNKGGI